MTFRAKSNRAWGAGLVVALIVASCGGSSDDPTAEPAASEAPSSTTATTVAPDDHAMDHDDGSMDHGDAMDHDDGSMDHGDGDQHGTGHESEVDVMYADLPADLKTEVDITKALVEKYKTAADAEKDGWQKATINLNGIGAHYLKGGPTGFLNDYTFDPANPNVLLFDGEGPDAKIAGASFILTDPNPQGYSGDLDVWHYHYGVCFDTTRFLVIAEVDGHEGSKISMSKQQCEAEGAMVFPIADLYMIHVWVAPDYIDDAPVFAHDHPKLYDGVTAESQL